MADKENTEITYKVLLLGDSSVGKTCFLKRYIDNTFQDAYLSTIGFDFKFKNVTLKDGKKVKVQLWDTAGQERFRTIAKSYYKGAHGIILVYDVTNQKSFDNIRNWVNQIKEEASSKVCIILIANKIDSDERVVSKQDGEKLAKNYELKIYEASAKENINVTEAFQDLIESINENYSNIVSSGTKIQKPSQTKQEKSGCCK
jgi:Ras-related protein Rab-8A